MKLKNNNPYHSSKWCPGITITIITCFVMVPIATGYNEKKAIRGGNKQRLGKNLILW